MVIPTLEPIWAATLPAAGYTHHLVKFGGECTANEIDSLIAEGRRVGAKTVIGCGGGKVGGLMKIWVNGWQEEGSLAGPALHSWNGSI